MLNTPPDATSQIEPLDVYFPLLFEAICKRAVSFVIVHDLDFHVSNHNSIFRLMSLVCFVFSAPRFNKFLYNSWFASGYLAGDLGRFGSPVGYPQLGGNCESHGWGELCFMPLLTLSEAFLFQTLCVGLSNLFMKCSPMV